VRLARWRGGHARGLAWIYHNGRIYRQTEDEDKVDVVRFVGDQDTDGEELDEEGEDASATECFSSNSRIRMIVDAPCECCRLDACMSHSGTDAVGMSLEETMQMAQVKIQKHIAQERARAKQEVDEEAVFASRKWSGINRGERYRARAGDTGPAAADESNPCAGVIDPITLEPVVNPAISPFGHVMGLATWAACLAETAVCPFTKQPLRQRDLVVLTHHNIERYRQRIIA
jgi:hypothetical protein